MPGTKMVFTHLCRRNGVVDAFPLENTSGGGGMWGRGVIFLPGSGARPRPGHTGGQLGRGEGWGYEAAGSLARRPAVQTLLSRKEQKKVSRNRIFNPIFPWIWIRPLNAEPKTEIYYGKRNFHNCAKLGLIVDGQVRLKTLIISCRVNKKSRISPRIRNQIRKVFIYQVRSLGGVHLWKNRM